MGNKMGLVQVGRNAWAIPADEASQVEFVKKNNWPDGRPAIRRSAGPACEWIKDIEVCVLVTTIGGGSYESEDGMSTRESGGRSIWRKANRFCNRRARDQCYEAFVWAEPMPVLPNWHSPICPGTEIQGPNGYRAGNSYRPVKIHEAEDDLPCVAWEESLEPIGFFIGQGLITDDQIENEFLSSAIYHGWDI